MRIEIGRCRRACEQFDGVDLDIEGARSCIDANDVAVLDLRNRSTVGRLWRDVNRRRNFAGRTGHASVGHQGDAMAAILQHTEHRRQLVQFGHADRTRPLETHDRDEVSIQIAALECGLDVVLIVEHDGRRFDDQTVRRHG